MAFDDILQYYKRELLYLREQSGDFSQRHPKVAASLGLHAGTSLDPHTERLIEATAFLAARVHRDIDQTSPEIAVALLENVCPSLARPVPAMTVAQCELDASQGKVTSGAPLPRHTVFEADAKTGEHCRFRAAWDALLWPLSVHKATLAPGTLRLALGSPPGTRLRELELTSLRFHLAGDWSVTIPWYEALVSAVTALHLEGPGGVLVDVPVSDWREIGFDAEHTILPVPSHGHPAYALIQEYFALPAKFLFFELQLAHGLPFDGQECELVFHLQSVPKTPGPILGKHFRLNCVPVVNLFPQVSEPVIVDQQQYEYRLSADQREDAEFEVYSVERVLASSPLTQQHRVLGNYCGLDFQRSLRRRADGDDDAGNMFWSMRREARLRGDGQGTEVYLSFIDSSDVRSVPLDPVMSVNLLCMNRRLAGQVPAGARLRAERPGQQVQAHCLYPPSVPRSPPLDSATLWRLVSLLTLNYQSVTSGDDACAYTQAMLRIFASDADYEEEQVRGLTGLTTRPTMFRCGDDAWRGWCAGTQITMSFDAGAFAGSSPLLMAAVLGRFFAMHTTLNTFVQCQVLRGEEVWKQWKPMAGSQALL